MVTKLASPREYVISRCCVPKGFGKIVEALLHHFSDASMTAYAAVSFIRVCNSEKKVHCSLLISKSRLGPLKTITIPRLEVAAATLPIQLDCMLRKELDYRIQSSTFGRQYNSFAIRKKGFKAISYVQYVANRVALIRTSSCPSQ